MDDFCGSPFWNTTLTWDTDTPQFTSCFELTALVWTPCVFLFFFGTFEMLFIRSAVPRKVHWHFLNLMKFLVVCVMFVISVVDLVYSLTVEHNEEIFAVHHVAPAVRAASFIFLACFMYFNKREGLVTSGTQFLFSLLLMVLAIPRVITISHVLQEDELISTAWAEYESYSTMVFFATTCVFFFLQCFADKDDLEQRQKGQPKYEQYSTEETSSFLRQLTFQWFDKLVYKGYRRPLTTDDMSKLNNSLQVKSVTPVFDKYWAESVEKSRQKLKKKGSNEAPQGSIMSAMVFGLGGPFFFAGLLKLCIDCLSFVSPQILSLLITFAVSDEQTWKGYVYTAALFGTALLSAFLNSQYSYYSYIVGFKIRSALISAIYRKSLRTSIYKNKEATVGQIVNLMAIDAQRFYELTAYLHFLWSGPFVIALSIYFLWQELGISVLAGLAVLIIFVPFNAVVAVKIRQFMVQQMKFKDERLKFMNEILGGIKVIKLYAWEKCFQKIVQNIRLTEVQVLWKAARWEAVTFFAWGLAPYLVSLASFTVFVLSDPENILTPSKTFVSLSLFNILRMPMIMFPMMISLAMQALVAVNRINEYLNSPEIEADNVLHEKDDNAIKVKGGTFSWGEDAVLSDINFNVPKGKLWAVVGSIGSGKSSLVSALLGEMQKLSGHVNTDGSIAYVPQVAWIQNCTLMDNILFGNEMKSKHYKKVIEACALKTDIDILVGGDQTEIGEKGINLSGGQKQRISLARAVYRNADVYLFDDPLSAVDAHVGKHIFDNIISNDGVLANKTRFLITHALSFLPQVDNIIVLQNGRISEMGSYRELMQQNGAFSELVREQTTNEEHQEEVVEEFEEQDVLEQPVVRKRPVQKSMSILSRSSNGSGRFKRQDTALKPTTKLIEAEESAVGSVGFQVYFTYFRNIGWKFVIWAVLANACTQGISVYTNMWLSDWAEDPLGHLPENRDVYLGVYGGLGAVQGITNLMGSLVLAYGCIFAARAIHDRLLASVTLFPMSFFDRTPLGRIVNRFSKDIDTVDNVLLQTIRAFLSIFCSTIGIIVVISIATPIFTAVILPIAFVYYVMQTLYLSASRQLKRIESVTRSPIYSHFTETITGQTVVRAYSDQARFIQVSEDKLNINQSCLYPSMISMRWLQIRLEAIGSLVVMFAALFTILSRGDIASAIVGLSISYSLQITQTLNMLVRMSTEIETNIVSVERIEEYTNEKREPYYDGKNLEKNWPKEGRIRFADFSLSYKEGSDLVLKKLSFDVKPGEKVGIVGRTGAGKSSLTLALFRIIEAAEGRIEIDDDDISKITLYSLRSHLTIIPQDPVMFSGTLRMNVDPHEAYSDSEIWTAFEHSNLKPFVKELKEGLNYILSEGGENLSVGQRQLICLARALLRKTKILVLDEATAAVDLETDSVIQKTIQTEFKDCTVLTIAHRINTIMDSDRIIVLDKGQVAEYDTPSNLLQNPSSIFYGMAKDAGIIKDHQLPNVMISSLVG